MAIFRNILLAIAIYVLFIVLSRYSGLVNPILDWIVLILSSLIPLAINKTLKRSAVVLISIFCVNAVILFFGGFWLIGVLFGDGL